MWMTHIWVLGVIACSNPGTAEEHCTGHFLEGYASLRLCHEAVPAVQSLLQEHKPFETPMQIEATCYQIVPDREA